MASLSAEGMLRSPTFFVGAERQKKNLEDFQRREQQLAEAYHKNKPLCFNARSYQKTHPAKAAKGHKDADACLSAPMILGVADGVSQIEDFGIDASELPNELLKVCEELAMYQLRPEATVTMQDAYRGPIPLLRRAFEATESLGSLTVVLAIMDNSTRIHGKRHPMVAIITIGDCELLILRRVEGRMSPMQAVCHTEMQRIDGHAQTPLQLARVDARIDPDFHEGITIEVIEKGSAVHCVSAYEGDIVVMGSDGVFDNLFLDEITDLVNRMVPPGSQLPTPPDVLKQIATHIVEACHAKTFPGPMGQLPQAPIGRGGKKDDTSCVVAEVIEWSEHMTKNWKPKGRNLLQWQGLLGSLSHSPFEACCAAAYDSEDEFDLRPKHEAPRISAPSPAAVAAGGYDTHSGAPQSQRQANGFAQYGGAPASMTQAQPAPYGGAAPPGTYGAGPPGAAQPYPGYPSYMPAAAPAMTQPLMGAPGSQYMGPVSAAQAYRAGAAGQMGMVPSGAYGASGTMSPTAPPPMWQPPPGAGVR